MSILLRARADSFSVVSLASLVCWTARTRSRYKPRPLAPRTSDLSDHIGQLSCHRARRSARCRSTWPVAFVSVRTCAELSLDGQLGSQARSMAPSSERESPANKEEEEESQPRTRNKQIVCMCVCATRVRQRVARERALEWRPSRSCAIFVAYSEPTMELNKRRISGRAHRATKVGAPITKLAAMCA